MGRGLGYSGAVRVAGAALALAQQGATGQELVHRSFRVGAELEGHADNAAASAHGGLVVVSGEDVAPVPLGIDADVAVWIPRVTTSTDRSRRALPPTVPFADAVHNLGRTALLVAALATGRIDVLDRATSDRLHQAVRLTSVPGAADAIEAGRAAGAWACWLSGSGPTVACLVPGRGQSGAGTADAVLAALASVDPDASVRRLAIDRVGIVVSERPVTVSGSSGSN